MMKGYLRGFLLGGQAGCRHTLSMSEYFLALRFLATLGRAMSEEPLSRVGRTELQHTPSVLNTSASILKFHCTYSTSVVFPPFPPPTPRPANLPLPPPQRNQRTKLPIPPRMHSPQCPSAPSTSTANTPPSPAHATPSTSSNSAS